MAFEQTLQRVVELGCQQKEQSPWARTVRTCQQLLKQKQALWTFLETPGIEPTNNAAVDEVFSAGVRALRQSVIQRKITGLLSNSRGVQSAHGALCRSRLLTVTLRSSQPRTHTIRNPYRYLDHQIAAWLIRKYKQLRSCWGCSGQLLKRIRQQRSDLFAHWRGAGVVVSG